MNVGLGAPLPDEVGDEVVEEACMVLDEVFVPVSGCCEDCDDLLAAGGSR